MQIFTIASGSGGNCTLLCDGKASFLIDAGISARRISHALSSLGKSPNELSGILITHEHGDHICGLKTLTKQFEVPIFAPRTVANHLRWSIAGVDSFITELSPGKELYIDGVSVLPFLTPHDTPESVGYRISGSRVFGFCTDCGHVTEGMREGMGGAHAVMIEANHDLEMLRNGSYPLFLKRRVLSDRGHLSNESCGEFALSLYDSGAKKIILAHLSRENNTPDLALKTVSSAFAREGINYDDGPQIFVAPEKDVFPISLEEVPLC